MKNNRCFIIMGVAGSGKTTIGKILAKRTGSYFIEGDEFHSKKNISKMKSGIPLNDEDRYDWLKKISKEISIKIKENNVVVACSALKEKYRDILITNNQISFIYLKIDKKTCTVRLKNRPDHFMPDTLVESQFLTLEEPNNSIICNANDKIEKIIVYLIPKMKLQ